MPPEVHLPADLQVVSLRTGLPGRVSCYVLGETELAIVDPGTSFRGELEKIERRLWPTLGRGGALRCILLTHHHRDHTAGALHLSEELRIPIAAHPFTLEQLPNRPGRRWLLPLEEGTSIELGRGLALRVLHTPGHAAGHLCFHDDGRGVLVCGDMVAGNGTTLIDPGEGDMAEYLASLERLAGLQPELLLPGHGPPLRDATRVIRELIQHRLWREQRVLAALEDAPRSCSEITRRAYAEASPWRWPLAYRSTLSHLRKLEAEGRAGRSGDGWVRSSG